MMALTKKRNLLIATNARVKKCRNKKRQAEDEKVAERPRQFNSASAFVEATAKARRALHNALPGTPRRAKAVTRRLYQERCDKSPMQKHSRRNMSVRLVMKQFI